MSVFHRTRVAAVACLPIVLASLTACDVVTADFRSQDKAEWRKTYELAANGRVEVVNVNGKIEVTAGSGNTVEVVAFKTARAGSPEAAKQLLERIEIVENASASAVRIETRLPRGGGMFNSGGSEVRYTVRMPAGAEARMTTVNGGIEIEGITGRVVAETTNGGVQGRDIGGPIEASTTNGGVDMDITRVTDGGVRLECTNGGIKLRLPADSHATVSASTTNGGIETTGLSLERTDSNRRRLDARLNGGGPSIRMSGTNGGIRISGR